MEILPHSIILEIFSYLPFKFIRSTISLVCKTWCQLVRDKTLVKKATREELSEIKAKQAGEQCVDSFIQVVEWRPNVFQSIYLSGAKTMWRTFGIILETCQELRVLNMAQMMGEATKISSIQAVKLVELNVSETLITDELLIFLTLHLSDLGMINISRCYKLSNFGIVNASFPLLRFLAMAECNLGIESILCCLNKLGLFAMCVKGVELSRVDTKLLLEQYPDIAEIGIPALCGLPEGTVFEVTLPQHCSYCLNTPQATLLSVEEVISGSWMEL